MEAMGFSPGIALFDVGVMAGPASRCLFAHLFEVVFSEFDPPAPMKTRALLFFLESLPKGAVEEKRFPPRSDVGNEVADAAVVEMSG